MEQNETPITLDLNVETLAILAQQEVDIREQGTDATKPTCCP